MMKWNELYAQKKMTAEEAVGLVSSGDRIMVGAASSMATPLVNALCQRTDVEDITLFGGLVFEELQCFAPENKDRFRFESFFMGPQERKNRAGYSPVHLSRVGQWFREYAKANVAFLEVSPPDSHGHVSFGASGTCVYADALDTAQTIVLLVNDRAPFVFGQDNTIHISKAAAIVESSREIPAIPDVPPTDVEKQIASYIVDKVPDGATIQLGIGGIANAVGYGLDSKTDLGVHTEMLTESIIHLMELGVITNRKKTFFKDKAVISFSMGSRRMYDYMDRNTSIYAAPFAYVNDPTIIAKNDNMVSINTALMIDLQGQVYSEALGFGQYSGTGGQVDFTRGAQLAKGGQAFMALSSTVSTKKEGVKSRIVLLPPPGTTVTTGRQEAQYVVTEHGCANIKGLPLRERAKALIGLAAPQFREELREQAGDAGLL